jgi:hypothetical protein
MEAPPTWQSRRRALDPLMAWIPPFARFLLAIHALLALLCFVSVLVHDEEAYYNGLQWNFLVAVDIPVQIPLAVLGSFDIFSKLSFQAWNCLLLICVLTFGSLYWLAIGLILDGLLRKIISALRSATRSRID